MAALSVTPDPLSAGGQATITYSGGTPNGSVTVDIDNGESPPNDRTDTVQIQLDENGNGTATWNVPSSGWESAGFNESHVQEVTRQIIGGSPPH